MRILLWVNKTRVSKNGTVPIIMRITFNSLRASLPTGVDVGPGDWDAKKQVIRSSSPMVKEFNATLMSLKTLAWTAYNEAIRSNTVITPQGIKDAILRKNQSKETFLQAFAFQLDNLRSRMNFDIALNTIKKYETAERKLKKFLKEKGREDILLSEITPKLITELDLYMRITEKLKHNAIVKNMQQFHRVIQVSIDNGWLQKDPFDKYSFKTDDTERGYLTAVELAVMEKLPMASKRLEHVRDIFVFCCYTGLAFVDVSKLSRVHFEQDGNGVNWIRINRTKSKTRASIPVLPKAQQILDKYAESAPTGLDKPILPVISNQNLNKYLKEISALCGIKKRVSMHLARHTFATTVTLEQGIDISTVSKMLGHKNIKTTQIYAKVTELKIAEDMKKLLDKPG